MSDNKFDTLTIAKAILDTARKFGIRKYSIRELMPFARCVEITLNNQRDVAETIPAVRFCAELQLPVGFKQLGIPGNEETIAYAAKRCIDRNYNGKEAKFSKKMFFLAFSKINNWGDQYSGNGSTMLLARDLLKMLDEETIRKLKKIRKQKMAFLGDSLMVKMSWAAYGCYPEILSDFFKLINKKVDIINAGIGGQTSWQGLERLKRDVISKKPDICFIGFGGNDLSRTKGGKELKWMSKFRKSMTDIVKGLKQKGVKPVLLNGSRQYWIDDRIYKREVTDAIGEIGRKYNVPIIDTHGICWTGDKRSWLWLDDVHLNNSGHVKFANEVLKFLSRSQIGKRRNKNILTKDRS
ncbi:MAG: hypothetical protein A2231_10065 [Candidatus Firestonebacteria bacterium RIFOXYA2_FULL_40_8]|nr:MAG: hypothetical protein A2231_10065 [Candidatus Firestonebacteria bacterium RIFOXYA2_FULL_40_8]